MAIENPYDHALKILARTYPAEFLQLGFPNQSARLLEEQANVELALEIDRVDFLHKIELQGTTAYLHIDFQLEYEYIFAPLLPVLTQPMDEALLREERELILTHEKDIDRQRTLLTTAILIAAQSKLFSSDFLWTLFQEDQMDLDNPVIAKLFDRAYGEKLAAEKQKLAAEAHKAEQKLQEELAVVTQRATTAEAAAIAAEAAATATRREAEIEAIRRETEITQQWQELMFKVLEHRFPSVPMALILLLQAVKPVQRSRVSDIILDSPDVDSCLQALRHLQAEA